MEETLSQNNKTNRFVLRWGGAPTLLLEYLGPQIFPCLLGPQTAERQMDLFSLFNQYSKESWASYFQTVGSPMPKHSDEV